MRGLRVRSGREANTDKPPTPEESKIHEEAAARYFAQEQPFHDRVNVAADIAMRLDAVPGVSRLQCRIYYRTAAAVALVLAEKDLP